MYKLVRPFIFSLDPEEAHQKAIAFGKSLSDSWLRNIVGWFYNFQDPVLETEFCGIKFRNPVGLAAGFDKNAELVRLMPYLGFGFVEVGSVTAQPCAGNPKPRLFRLPKERALVNSIGLDNDGVHEVASRLYGPFRIPVGVNIAKTNDGSITGKKAIQDFCYSFDMLCDVGDYVTLNISCPNTLDRTFEDKVALDELLSALNISDFNKPVLLKLSHDISFSMLDGILDVAERRGISGYVISNSKKIENGGLSGKPLGERSTELIRYVSRCNPNIVGVGGIFSAEDAYEKLRAGASLVQIYTGLVYEGPGLVRRINKGLIKIIRERGLSSVQEIRGLACSRGKTGKF